MIAYCARYGHQRVDDLLRMSIRDLILFSEAISDIVGQENHRSPMPGEE